MREYNIHEVVAILHKFYISESYQVISKWIREGKIIGTRSENRKEGYKVLEDDLFDFIEERRPGLPSIMEVYDDYLKGIQAKLSEKEDSINTDWKESSKLNEDYEKQSKLQPHHRSDNEHESQRQGNKKVENTEQQQLNKQLEITNQTDNLQANNSKLEENKNYELVQLKDRINLLEIENSNLQKLIKNFEEQITSLQNKNHGLVGHVIPKAISILNNGEEIEIYNENSTEDPPFQILLRQDNDYLTDDEVIENKINASIDSQEAEKSLSTTEISNNERSETDNNKFQVNGKFEEIRFQIRNEIIDELKYFIQDEIKKIIPEIQQENDKKPKKIEQKPKAETKITFEDFIDKSHEIFAKRDLHRDTIERDLRRIYDSIFTNDGSVRNEIILKNGIFKCPFTGKEYKQFKRIINSSLMFYIKNMDKNNENENDINLPQEQLELEF